MEDNDRVLSEDEAAEAAAVDVRVVRIYAACGVGLSPRGYQAADLVELRRVRRLMDDLGLEPAAIEVVLRMRQRMLALQAEVQRLQGELRAAQLRPERTAASDSEWMDV